MPAAKMPSRGRDLHPPGPRHRHIPGPGLALLLGVWLVIVSLRWTYGDTDSWLDARWNDAVVGAVLALFGFVRLLRPVLGPLTRTLGVLLGGWLIIAPVVAGYGFGADSTPATANDVLVGVVVITLALIGRI